MPQVKIVAILMMVQGGLQIVMGLLLLAMAVGMPMLVAANPGGGPPPPQEMFWIMGGLYGGLGILTTASAILLILAGIKNLRYQGRVLGFVALGSGAVTVLGCYCAPTAIALGVYGLIVYLNPDVARAFELAKKGYSPEQIQRGL